MLNKVKKIYNKITKPWRFALIGIFLAVGLLILELYTKTFFFHSKYHDHEIVNIYNIEIIILTALVVAIAYIQLNAIHKTSEANKDINKSEFLLRIDERLGKTNILKARKVIHEIFVEEYRKKDSSVTYEIALNRVADKIVEMSKEKAEDFIYLYNLLEFLETIGYFYHRDKVTKPEVKELFGESITFYAAVFKLYIESRQKHNKSYFNYFTILSNDIKDH